MYLAPSSLLAAAALAAFGSAQTVVAFIAHGPFPGGVGYDPVTDQVAVVDSNADTVSFYDRATRMLAASFAAPSGSVVGCHIDVATGNLWVVDEGEMVFEVTRAGTVVRSWSAQPTLNDASALTMDPCTDTLWISNDSANVVVEFTKTGTPTGARFTPAGSVDGDGCVYDPYTRTFLMGEDAGDQILVVDRTGAAVRAISLAGLGLSPEGLAIDPITRNVFVGNGLAAPLGVYEVSGVLTPPPAGAIARYGTSCGATLALSDAVRDDGTTCAGVWLGFRSGAAPGNLALLHLGLTRQNIPLSFLGSNCTLYALPDLFTLAAATNANGRFGVRLPLPAGTRGLALRFWGADIVAAQPIANTASGGLELVIQ